MKYFSLAFFVLILISCNGPGARYDNRYTEYGLIMDTINGCQYVVYNRPSGGCAMVHSGNCSNHNQPTTKTIYNSDGVLNEEPNNYYKYSGIQFGMDTTYMNLATSNKVGYGYAVDEYGQRVGTVIWEIDTTTPFK